MGLPPIPAPPKSQCQSSDGAQPNYLQGPMSGTHLNSTGPHLMTEGGACAHYRRVP